MMRSITLNKRKIAAGLLIASGLVFLIVPFLFSPHVQPATTPPPTGGNGGNGGTPPCTTNCGGPTDKQAPQTTSQITGRIHWTRNNVQYYYPNFTITLHAVDDENLSSISLNDTGTLTSFQAHGTTSSATFTATTNGLHTLSYYSTDRAGNKETAHHTVVGLAKPDVSDIQNQIANSGIDSQGIKNALTVKVERARVQLSMDRVPHGLNALTNQLNALEGKHGLDQGQVDLLLAMISAITA